MPPSARRGRLRRRSGATGSEHAGNHSSARCVRPQRRCAAQRWRRRRVRRSGSRGWPSRRLGASPNASGGRRPRLASVSPRHRSRRRRASRRRRRPRAAALDCAAAVHRGQWPHDEGRDRRRPPRRVPPPPPLRWMTRRRPRTVTATAASRLGHALLPRHSSRHRSRHRRCHRSHHRSHHPSCRGGRRPCRRLLCPSQPAQAQSWTRTWRRRKSCGQGRRPRWHERRRRWRRRWRRRPRQSGRRPRPRQRRQRRRRRPSDSAWSGRQRGSRRWRCATRPWPRRQRSTPLALAPCRGAATHSTRGRAMPRLSSALAAG